MKRLFKFKYPKLVILLLMIILAYFIFSNSDVREFIDRLGSYSYLGSFIAGIFFAFGFTAPFAVGFFVSLKTTGFQIFINAIIGGAGAMLADLTIFKIIKINFIDEFKSLEKTKIFLNLNKFFLKPINKIKIYLLYAFVGIVIASPLPDEIGVSMLAGLTKIKLNVLSVISFILNSLGILVLILL